jgi:hypothetical protein
MIASPSTVVRSWLVARGSWLAHVFSHNLPYRLTCCYGREREEENQRAPSSHPAVAQYTQTGREEAGQWAAWTWVLVGAVLRGAGRRAGAYGGMCVYVRVSGEACVVSFRVARGGRSLPMELETHVPQKSTGRPTRQVRLCTTVSVDAP